MDHLFTYKEDPELILFYCAAFLLNNKNTLMTQVFTIDDMFVFQSTQSTVPFKKVSTLAHQLHQKYR